MRWLGSVALVSLVGCGAPYKFVAHAEPNPFTRPGCRAVLEVVHADRLVVDDEPVLQWLREKQPEDADKFDADVRASNVEFQQQIFFSEGGLFMPGAPDNTFVVRPYLMRWHPGSLFSKAIANLVVDVLAPNGQTLDRIMVETHAGDLTAGQRMRTSLRDAGKAVSRYIDDNWLCAQH